MITIGELLRTRNSLVKQIDELTREITRLTIQFPVVKGGALMFDEKVIEKARTDYTSRLVWYKELLRAHAQISEIIACVNLAVHIYDIDGQSMSLHAALALRDQLRIQAQMFKTVLAQFNIARDNEDRARMILTTEESKLAYRSAMRSHAYLDGEINRANGEQDLSEGVLAPDQLELIQNIARLHISQSV